MKISKKEGGVILEFKDEELTIEAVAFMCQEMQKKINAIFDDPNIPLDLKNKYAAKLVQIMDEKFPLIDAYLDKKSEESK